MSTAEYLAHAVNDKHAINAALADYRADAAAALAVGRSMDADRLVELARPFYGHERWVRGCGHETAARETNEMLDRTADQMGQMLSDLLQRRVIDGAMTYEQYTPFLAQRTGALAHAIGRAKESLAAEGMGTDPAYFNGRTS